MENLTITKEKQEALELHQQILFSAERAVTAYVDTCKGLKRMRDTKLYLELGFNTFEDYSEKAVGIKQRQAYYYISTLEKLGEQFLQSNANLGPSKLALLTEIPLTEREEFVKQNDLAGMTVEKVKALVEENNAKGEQIEILYDKLEETTRQYYEASQEVAELEKALEHEQNKPVEVAVAEPDEETLKKIREQAEKEAQKSFLAEKKELKNKFKEEQEKAVAAATEKAQKELEDYKAQMAAAKDATAKAIERAEQLQKQLAVTSSPEATKFIFYYDALSKDLENVIESLKKLQKENPDVAEKYSEAMKRYHRIFSQNLRSVGIDIDG